MFLWGLVGIVSKLLFLKNMKSNYRIRRFFAGRISRNCPFKTNKMAVKVSNNELISYSTLIILGHSYSCIYVSACKQC